MVHDVRGRLLDAAERLGEELGVEGITMRQLAACAGLATSSLYQSFESKASLMRELQLRFQSQYAAAITDAVTGVGGPRTRLYCVCVAHVEFARSSGWRYGLAFDSGELDLAGIEHGAARAFFEGVTACLRPGDTGVALRLWVAIHGLASTLVKGGPAHHSTESIDEERTFIDEYVSMLLRGVGADAAQ